MPTSIKQALKKWEEATGRKAADSKEIKLVGVSPPIEKMEGPFHLLVNLEKLSLSTNMIQNIQNLQSFKSLKILSLGRNVLKSLQGVEAASETLEQLWISYNQIDKLKPLRNLLKLKVSGFQTVAQLDPLCFSQAHSETTLKDLDQPNLGL